MTPRGPALRPGVAIIEQVFRGEPIFVVKDPTTQKYYRFRAAEARVLRAFDGTSTVAEIAETLSRAGVAVSTAAVAAFARTLSGLGLLEQSLAERTELLLERLQQARRHRQSLFRGEALRMRWSFGDSDAFFDRLIPWFRWCFTRGFAVASGLVVLAYAWILSTRWTEFAGAVSATFAPNALGLGALIVLVVTLVVLTFIHEAAHGFACKHFGGEVRETGFMLLYLTPAFYCNVNDAWGFSNRRARLLVTVSGPWIELVVTSVATLVWLVVAPGTLIADVAVATMIVGGFSAVLTNANPLLPLDGYFALADYLEIPNLRHQAAAHLAWWVRRHVLRMELPEPAIGPRERRILLVYGALAVLYLGAFFTWLGLVVLSHSYRAVGLLGGGLVLLAIIALVWRRLTALWRGVILAVRVRAGGAEWRRWRRRGPLIVAALLLVTAVVPWSIEASGSFIVVPRRVLAVTAPDSGIVAEVRVAEGARVSAGVPVARVLELGRARLVAIQRGVLDSVAAARRLARAALDAAAEARLEAAERAAAATLAAWRGRAEQDTLRARIAGTVVTPRPELQVGRRLEAGDTLLVLHDLTELEARAVLAGAGSARIAPGARARLLFYQAPHAPFEASVASLAPVGRSGGLEIRVPLPTDAMIRPGSSGEVRVFLRRSTVLGALWWALRSRIRSDLLL